MEESATSYKDIIKQKDPHYLSEFIPYKLTIPKQKIISFDEIIKCKTGIEDDKYVKRNVKIKPEF